MHPCFFLKDRLFILPAIHSFVVDHFTTYQLHVVPCSKTQTPEGAIAKKKTQLSSENLALKAKTTGAYN